jgi:hypothetical protein
MENLLKKNLKDMTPDELQSLEKPLGTATRPFPMWGTQRKQVGTDVTLEQVLSVIADDTYPMKVYSNRPYEEVVALAYCDMPVPSMLPLFFDGLERRKPESTNRTQMMIGDPGHGKSFLGALQSRLRSRESAEALDCGGKNMRELLFEMVLDFGSGDALPGAIDKRAAAGVLQAMSVGLLLQLNSLTTAPEDVQKDDEKFKAWKESNTFVRQGKDGRLSIDWEALKAGSPEKVNKAFDILTRVSTIEGLDNAGGNALGMNSQYGPLVRKWMAGEEIVLDEYNKSREGTDDNLQTVWQFMIGEIRECTVENPLKNKDATAGPTHFTFKREDLKPGFFVTLTGNKKEDGITTRSLNKSVYSRLSPQTLPDPMVIDWQHRICQMLVGLPVSTLYMAFEEKADANPAAFGEWLLNLRRAKAKADGVPVPELQETLLQNWKNVLNASEKLAHFYDFWAETTNAEKITSTNPDLVEEVDEEYSKKEGIDFRKIKQHLEEAVPIRPRMKPDDAPVNVDFGSWATPPKLSAPVEETQALRFGTRLTEFLERMVYEKTEAVGKKKLYNKLRSEMEKIGLRDITLKEGARSAQKSVEDSLNISVFFDGDLRRQSEATRKMFCAHIRAIYPDVKASDDQIAMPEAFSSALRWVANDNEHPAPGTMFAVNRDTDSLSLRPLVAVQVCDAVDYALRQQERDFTLEQVVCHSDVVTALAMPGVGIKSLSGVWENNIRKQLSAFEAQQADVDPTNDEDLDVAENASKTYPLGTTTLAVRNDDPTSEKKTVLLHIVHNSSTDETLIVSEKLPSKLAQAFAAARITHIDRHEEEASAKIAQALTGIVRGMPEKAMLRLTNAFNYRNRFERDLQQDEKASADQLARMLAANLVNDNAESRPTKYVVNRAAG